ncbi:hypothetical protein B0G62_101744 [Paraburkholderia eburnea]|uniref:Fe-S protein YdhL (DUF1289 family) n=2 Tax=Paraburkholderia eburnea TaxID=1189126 RepID=A0A2S4MNM3_9BURK|nr:DUF1289 domain-containing protein [Paraburkholderia eburnea]POR56346.1 hypothetical protein B0G62_101744 [Paraburkholderia eburnea]PRZ27473.1 hypothetical protein BX588_101743 [Paraburkholderia eburnea]
MSRCVKSDDGMNTPSPCINVCRMNEASGLCEGCLRTIDEIASWSTFDDEAKHAVWDAIEIRHAQWLALRDSQNVAFTTKQGDAA